MARRATGAHHYSTNLHGFAYGQWSSLWSRLWSIPPHRLAAQGACAGVHHVGCQKEQERSG